MDNTDSSVIDRLIDTARGVAEPDPTDVENRGTRRVDYDGQMAFVQWTPTGGKSISTIVQGKNISAHGMCIVSRFMLHVGHEGILLVERSDGERVVVGGKVVHCKYVGDMKHESGIRFISVPANLSMHDFRDEHGNLPQIGTSRRAA